MSVQADKKHELPHGMPISESIAGGDDVETVYLKGDEIDAYLEKYLKENPNSEIETRYINGAKEEDYTQKIEVRWLRPETPNEEIPPIIIREVPLPPIEQKPLKIIEIPDPNKNARETSPLIIRERPPVLKSHNLEPKIIYVPPSSKSQENSNKNAQIEASKVTVKLESRSASQTRLANLDKSFDQMKLQDQTNKSKVEQFNAKQYNYETQKSYGEQKQAQQQAQVLNVQQNYQTAGNTNGTYYTESQSYSRDYAQIAQPQRQQSYEQSYNYYNDYAQQQQKPQYVEIQPKTVSTTVYQQQYQIDQAKLLEDQRRKSENQYYSSSNQSKPTFHVELQLPVGSQQKKLERQNQEQQAYMNFSNDVYSQKNQYVTTPQTPVKQQDSFNRSFSSQYSYEQNKDSGRNLEIPVIVKKQDNYNSSYKNDGLQAYDYSAFGYSDYLGQGAVKATERTTSITQSGALNNGGNLNFLGVTEEKHAFKPFKSPSNSNLTIYRSTSNSSLMKVSVNNQ